MIMSATLLTTSTSENFHGNPNSSALCRRENLLTQRERPAMPPVDIDRIAPTLRKARCWIHWRYSKGRGGGRWGKTPASLTGATVSATNRKNWCSLSDLVDASKKHRSRIERDGKPPSAYVLGFGFAFSSDFWGLDIDHCFTDGVVAPAIQKLVQALGTYAEISPTGTGIKLFFKGRCPLQKSVTVGGFKVDPSKTYFTVTGARLPDGADDVAELSDLDVMHLLGPDTAGEQPSNAATSGSRYSDYPQALKVDIVRNCCRLLAGMAADYESWRDVLMIIHEEIDGEDTAVGLADEFSRLAPEKYQGIDDVRRIMETFRDPGTSGNKTLGSLVHWARESGYEPPRWPKAADELSVIEVEAEPLAGSKALAGKPSRPYLVLGLHDDPRLRTEKAIEALGRLGHDADDQLSRDSRVYQRDGRLVGVIAIPKPEVAEPNTKKSEMIEPEGLRIIKAIPQCVVGERLGACFRFARESLLKNGETVLRGLTDPPDTFVKRIVERGYYSTAIRPLAGVISAPTIRGDGTILQAPGYDARTGLVYEPTTSFPAIPEHPSREDAVEARELLEDVIGDFPFLTESDRAVAISYVLTLICRAAIDGPTPFFAFTANTPGTGKGLLVKVATKIANGLGPIAVSSIPKNEEMTKLLLSIARTGRPFLNFDNCSSRIKGDALEMSCTETTVAGRILGASEDTVQPWRTVLSATGNNLEFGGDMPRRVALCRLQTPHERPDERTDFRRPDLEGWVGQHRDELVVAALTIVRGYFAAERPKQSGKPWGSYEAWTSIIRDALLWCGAPDTRDTSEDLREADEALQHLEVIIGALRLIDPKGEGVTSAEFFDRVKMIEDINMPVIESLRYFFHRADRGGGRPTPYTATDAGRALGKIINRCCGGWRVERETRMARTRYYQAAKIDNTQRGGDRPEC